MSKKLEFSLASIALVLLIVVPMYMATKHKAETGTADNSDNVEVVVVRGYDVYRDGMEDSSYYTVIINEDQLVSGTHLSIHYRTDMSDPLNTGLEGIDKDTTDGQWDSIKFCGNHPYLVFQDEYEGPRTVFGCSIAVRDGEEWTIHMNQDHAVIQELTDDDITKASALLDATVLKYMQHGYLIQSYRWDAATRDLKQVYQKPNYR
jgi:hypothetical protein